MNLSFQKVEGFWLPISDNLFSVLLCEVVKISLSEIILFFTPELISCSRLYWEESIVPKFELIVCP